jgi:hypothetical protein
VPSPNTDLHSLPFQTRTKETLCCLLESLSPFLLLSGPDLAQGLKHWKELLDAKVPIDETLQLKVPHPHLSTQTQIDSCPCSQLYGLYRSAKDGAAPQVEGGDNIDDATAADPDSKQYKQLQAWRACGTMSPPDAQRAFILALYSVSPGWEYVLA